MMELVVDGTVLNPLIAFWRVRFPLRKQADHQGKGLGTPSCQSREPSEHRRRKMIGVYVLACLYSH